MKALRIKKFVGATLAAAQLVTAVWAAEQTPSSPIPKASPAVLQVNAENKRSDPAFLLGVQDDAAI